MKLHKQAGKTYGALALALGMIGVGTGGALAQSRKISEGQQAQKKLGTLSEKQSEAEITRKRTITEKYNVPTLKSVQEKADINRMAPEHFMALGVPEKFAKDIVRYRMANGGFDSVNDLKKVPGMNQSWLEKNKDRLTVAG